MKSITIESKSKKAQSIIGHHPSNIQQVKTKCYRASPESSVAQYSNTPTGARQGACACVRTIEQYFH